MYVVGRYPSEATKLLIQTLYLEREQVQKRYSVDIDAYPLFTKIYQLYQGNRSKNWSMAQRTNLIVTLHLVGAFGILLV